jgi:ribonuclease PH
LKRIDGRAAAEARPVNVTRDYLPFAEGSVLFETGETRVICSATVEEKVPGWLRGSGQGWVTAEYSMLPRATEFRTTREVVAGRPKGRTSEIQRLIGRSLRSVVDLDQLGEVQIILDCDVINADGGTRTASISGAFIALHDALTKLKTAGRLGGDWPLTGFVAAISVGILEGVPFLDLNYKEDSQADVDMNVVMNSDGELIEVQGTAERGSFGRGALDELLDLGEQGIADLISMQQSLLG